MTSRSISDRTPDKPGRTQRIDQCGPLDQLGPTGTREYQVSFDAVRRILYVLKRAGRDPLGNAADLHDAAELLRAMGLVPDPRSYDNLPTCPTCSVPAGSQCREFSSNGKAMKEPHPARLKAFAQMFETRHDAT